MPSLADPVAGWEEWCQQRVAIVVIASKFWEAIGRARCFPCDVGLMLMV